MREHALVERLGLVRLEQHLVVDARNPSRELDAVRLGQTRAIEHARKGAGQGAMLVCALGGFGQALPQRSVVRFLEKRRFERRVGAERIA